MVLHSGSACLLAGSKRSSLSVRSVSDEKEKGFGDEPFVGNNRRKQNADSLGANPIKFIFRLI